MPVPSIERWAQPVLLMLVWLAMERWVAVDPSKLQMWVAPPILGLGVFAIGRRLWHSRRPVALGLAVVLPVLFVMVPVVRDILRPEVPKTVEKLKDADPGAPDDFKVLRRFDNFRRRFCGRTYGKTVIPADH